jgi:hypothetical protein
MHSTSLPTSARQAPLTKPTYPVPTTVIFKLGSDKEVKPQQAVEKRCLPAGFQCVGQVCQRETFFDSPALADTRAGVPAFSTSCQAREVSSVHCDRAGFRPVRFDLRCSLGQIKFFRPPRRIGFPAAAGWTVPVELARLEAAVFAAIAREAQGVAVHQIFD